MFLYLESNVILTKWNYDIKSSKLINFGLSKFNVYFSFPIVFIKTKMACYEERFYTNGNEKSLLVHWVSQKLILPETGAYGGAQWQSGWVLACLRPRIQFQHLSRNKKIIVVLPRIIYSLHGLITSSYGKILIKELENCSTWQSLAWNYLPWHVSFDNIRDVWYWIMFLYQCHLCDSAP